MGATIRTYWIRINDIAKFDFKKGQIEYLGLPEVNEELMEHMPSFECNEWLFEALVRKELNECIVKDGHDDGDVVFILGKENFQYLLTTCRKLINDSLDARIQKSVEDHIVEQLDLAEYDEDIPELAVQLHASFVYGLELFEKYPWYALICEVEW